MKYVILFLAIFAMVTANAVTVTYTSESAFQAAAPEITFTVVNFDELQPGDGRITSTSYNNLGLSIVQRDGKPINVVQSSSIPGWHSYPNSISAGFGYTYHYNDAIGDNFDFIFDQPMNAAGLWLGNVLNVTVQFLAEDGTILASNAFNYGSDYQTPFYGAISDQGIKRIRTIDAAYDGDGIVFDDIQFGSPVPEASSIIFLMLGLAGVAIHCHKH